MGFFPLLVIVTNTAMENGYLNISLNPGFLFSQLYAQKWDYWNIFNILEKFHTVFYSDKITSHSPTSSQGIQFFYILTILVAFLLFCYYSILVDMKRHHIMDLL